MTYRKYNHSNWSQNAGWGGESFNYFIPFDSLVHTLKSTIRSSQLRMNKSAFHHCRNHIQSAHRVREESDLWRSTQRAVNFSHRSLATFACFHTERLTFKIRRRGDTSAGGGWAEVRQGREIKGWKHSRCKGGSGREDGGRKELDT